MSVKLVTGSKASAFDPLLASRDALKAQRLLGEVRSSPIQFSEKIIPTVEMGPSLMSDDLEGGFAKYGARRFYKYLKSQETLQNARAVCRMVCDKLGIDVHHYLPVRALAVGKFQVGECDELSWILLIKLWQAGVRNLFFVIANNPEKTKSHTFALLGKGVKEEILKTNPHGFVDPVLKTISRLKSAVVPDPLLCGKVIPAPKIAGCKEFTSYLEINKISQIKDIIPVDDSLNHPDALSTILKKADEVYNRSLKLLQTLPTLTPEISQAIKDSPICAICAETLQDLIQGTVWKKNEKAQKIWFEGTLEKANEIAKYLNAHGIKACEPVEAKSGSWLVMISNPDFDLLEKLPPFEQWAKEKSAQEKKSSDKSSSDQKRKAKEAQ